ncbi:hypothetical protein Dimus_020576 [Dionaea muscipula]
MKALDLTQTSRSLVLVALVDKLISEIGVHKVIAVSVSHATVLHEQASDLLLFSESTTSHRAWLAVEMLCTWKWPSGSALGTFLPLLLEYVQKDGDSISDFIVKILLDGALIYGARVKLRFFILSPPSKHELDEIEEPFLRALLALVSTLLRDSIWGKEKALALFELLANNLYIGEATNRNCLHILPPLVHVLIPHLQFHDKGSINPSRDLQSNSLPESIVMDWLQKTLIFPSLISGPPLEGMQEWFQLLISCYPLSVTEDVGSSVLERDPSMLERELLLSVFRRQRYDVHLSSAPNESPELHILLSRLVVIAVGYCWDEFNEEDWEFVLSNLKCWIEAVVVVIEEAIENADLALCNVSSVELDFVAEAMEHNILVISPSCIDTATNALYAFNLILALVQSQEIVESDKLTMLKTERFGNILNQIEEGILRVLLSSCVSEAMTSSIHYESHSLSIIGSAHDVHPWFWKMIGSVVVKSSPLAREEAIRSVERWGLSKGPISSLIFVLFSSKQIYSFKHAAFVLLSSSRISNWAVLSENTSFSLSLNPANDQGFHNIDPSSEDRILLRGELTCLVEKLTVELLDIDFLAEQRVNVLLAWCLLLSHLLSLPSSSLEREKLVQHIQESASSVILDMLFQHIPLEFFTGSSLKKRDAELPSQLSAIGGAASRAIRTGSLLFALESLWPIQPEKMGLLAGAVFGMMLRLLPAYVRGWYSDIRDRSALSAIEMFTKMWCSPHLIADELSQIKKAEFADESFSVAVSISANEVVATYTKDETGMDLVIRLPPSYPLRCVDVECTRSLGISEVKQRKWLLSMMAFVRNQNGALAEAIQIWKHNFDKAFEGIEECPICYSVIHTADHGLPRLACKTCKHKFHSACLYKWFSTAHKSTCPLCQSPF